MAPQASTIAVAAVASAPVPAPDGLGALVGLDARLAARARRAAAWVREQRHVTVVHHIDADGVTSGAIAAEALARAGIAHDLLAVKSLDDVGVAAARARLADSDAALGGAAGTAAVWTCDLGSAAYMAFAQAPRLVCDHHQLVRDGTEESFPHVNPLLDGLPGECVSGAGCALLVAVALDARNLDLLPMALVGAAGDRQDRPSFTGTNRVLADAAAARGAASVRVDLAFFGPETRPVRKFLALGDPPVPGLTGDARTVDRLLRDCGVDAASDTAWNGLDEAQRGTVRTALVEHLLDVGAHARAAALLREVTTFPGEPAGPTREAQEFATLLNSTARYGRADIGLAVARGDRGDAYEEALGLLLDHRKHLVGALDALAKRPIVNRLAIQHVHMEDAVLDTVVGIVAGMALGGDMGLRQDMPLVAFAFTPDGRTKASSRSPPDLHARGIDLSAAMREGAEAVGGQGGGHKGAAGATIPRGSEAAFLEVVDAAVARQLGIARPAPAGPPAAIPNLVRDDLARRRAGQQSITSF